jgi:ribonuclease HI
LPADPRPRLTIYADGAARGNPGPAGIGVVVSDERGRTVAEISEGIGEATNNVAEYRAAIEGLRIAAERRAMEVLLRSDSRLLVEQLSGRFRVKSPTLQRLHDEARKLLAGFERVTIEHVPREFNSDADRLANRGIDTWLEGPGRSYRRPEPPRTLFDDRS